MCVSQDQDKEKRTEKKESKRRERRAGRGGRRRREREGGRGGEGRGDCWREWEWAVMWFEDVLVYERSSGRWLGFRSGYM